MWQNTTFLLSFTLLLTTRDLSLDATYFQSSPQKASKCHCAQL
jgi:hypothetical protein